MKGAIPMEKDSGLHTGHRDRLRERFMKDPEGLAEHELLELLLFYVIPRRDTNDLAHTLIEECGSLLEVLKADPLTLTRINGVKSSTTVYLKVLAEVARRYTAAHLKGDEGSGVFDTPEKIARFVWPRFLGLQEERVYALLFDNGMRLLDCYHVCDGSVASAPLQVRRIVQRVFQKGAVGIVLAHNHPNGNATPSNDDYKATKTLEDALALMEIPLIEHYVFSDYAFAPIMTRFRGEDVDYRVASSLRDMLHERLHSYDVKEN